MQTVPLTKADIAAFQKSLAIPNLIVTNGQVLETTAHVSIASLGNGSLLQSSSPTSELTWSIDSVEATQDGAQVVINASMTLGGINSFIGNLAYHVTALLRMT